MADYQVTVYCLAYNHAAYIRRTLEGFVRQRTDFAFKVIVHDDASTDGTQEIIREYQQRYTDMIFPILQKENQYSRGVKITREVIFPLIDTEYMAVCEGDDYWTAEDKLQRQVDFLRAHPDFCLCVHDTELISGEGESLNRRMPGWDADREISAEEIIEVGEPLFHTSSCVFRAQVRKGMTPDFSIPGVGDYPMAIYHATHGRVQYLARTMSAYRYGAQGSWTQRVLGDPQRAAAHYRSVIAGLERMDALTEGKYHEAFVRATDGNRFAVAQLENRLLALLTDAGVRRAFLRRPLGMKLRTVGGMLLRKAKKIRKG